MQERIVLGANSNSIGICAEGDYNNETMPEIQKQAIIELIADIKSRRNIKWIKGHREILATSCPGNNFPLDEIKNAKPTSANNAQVQYSYKDFVRDVQKCIGAKVDGIAGKETLSKTVTVSAKKNRTHTVVKPIQKYLYSLGYTEVGNADGIAGSKFDSATKHFQRDNGCVQDGEFTARNKTWKKILKLA